MSTFFMSRTKKVKMETTSTYYISTNWDTGCSVLFGQRLSL